MKRLIVAAALLVAGCETTMAAVRESPPRVTYTTAKSVDATVRCLVDGYASSIQSPSVVPAGDGFTLTWDVANRMFIDVRPEGAGSRVSFYREGSLLFTDGYQRTAEGCRD